MSKKLNQWDNDATFGSDIIGQGAAWGDMRGKVKTAQIGFVRSSPRQVRKQGRVSNARRSKAGTARTAQVKTRV